MKETEWDIVLSEEDIRELIAKEYEVRKDMVTIHAEYRFIINEEIGDKVRKDYLYALVPKEK